MLTPKDAILFKIVHTCAKECLILKYKYIQNPWCCMQFQVKYNYNHLINKMMRIEIS